MTDNVFCGKCHLFHKYHPEGCPECHVIPALKANLQEAIHYIIGLRSPEMLGSTDMESFKQQSIQFTNRVGKALKRGKQ